MRPEDRPSLDEKYSRAISSSHLEVEAEHRGDVDLLVAAGWTRATLGTALYRLRAEFDGQRAAYWQAETALRQQRQEVRDILRRAQALRVADKAGSMALYEQAMQRAEQLAQDAERAALTARALIMVHLKSLREARDATGRYAVQMATQQRFMQPDDVVEAIASRALAVWIDPTCPACEGRGFNGEPGAARLLCRACNGSGRRTVELWSTQAGEQFGRALLVNMDRKTEAVNRMMHSYLRRNGRSLSPDQDTQQAMQERLQALRSTQAETD